MWRIVLWCCALTIIVPSGLAQSAGGWMKYSPEGTIMQAIETMAIDSTGRVWTAGKNTGVYSLYQGSWTHELDNMSVQALTVDASGTLWAFVDGVLYKRGSEGWVVESEEIFGQVYRAVVDREGTVWAVVNPAEIGVQLIYFKGGVWNGISLPIGTDIVTSLAVATDNTLWVGTPANGVFLVEEGFAHQFAEALPKLPSLHVRDILMGNNSDVWIATNQGVARYDGEDWKVFTKGKLALPESLVPALAFDHQHGLWALTRPLARYHEGMWDTVAWPGFSNGTFTTIAVDKENNIWLGANDGNIVMYDGVTTGVDDPVPAMRVQQHTNVYPNPFHSDLRVAYTVPEEMPVRVVVTDVLGREVRSLVQTVLPSGEHTVAWDGLDTGGRSVPAGMYYCRIVIGTSTSVVAMQKVL